MTKIEDIYTDDYVTGERVSLSSILLEFERRIEALEEENVATTNNLLELAYDYDQIKLSLESQKGQGGFLVDG